MAYSRRINDIDTPSKFWCAVPNCISDGRKKTNLEKYPWMQGVQFFPFPTEKKEKKNRQQWLKLINRENFEPKRHHRICSLHFVDSKPTEENPYPTLFPRNNFKQPLKERSQNAILKREQSCRETETDHCQSEDYILPSAFPIFDTQLNREVLCPVSSDIEVTTTTMKRGKIQ